MTERKQYHSPKLDQLRQDQIDDLHIPSSFQAIVDGIIGDELDLYEFDKPFCIGQHNLIHWTAGHRLVQIGLNEREAERLIADEIIRRHEQAGLKVVGFGME